jgi:hypothetical protein
MQTYAPAREVDSEALLVACSDHGFAPGLEDFVIEEFGLNRRAFHRLLIFGGAGILANPEVSDAKFQGTLEDMKLYHENHPLGTIFLSTHDGCAWYEKKGLPAHKAKLDLFTAEKETQLFLPKAEIALVYGRFADLQSIKTSRIIFDVVPIEQYDLVTAASD